MTILMVVDGYQGETRSAAIARRLKGALAEAGISVSEVARQLGVTQQKLSRRMTGLNPFDVEELDEICSVAGISFVYVTTGIREIPANETVPAAENSRLTRRSSPSVGWAIRWIITDQIAEPGLQVAA